MAISIKGYATFSKRHNSTKRPSGSYTTFSVVLKEETDSLNPIFILYSASYPTVNYIVWDTKYYFVDRIVIVANELYELHCSIDVLATYKTVIGNTTTFIERAASSSAYDTMLTDNALTVSNSISNMASSTFQMPKATGDLFFVPVFGNGGLMQYVFSNYGDASAFFNTGTTFEIDGTSISKTDWLNALQMAGFTFGASDITNYMGEMTYSRYIPPATNPPWYITTQDIIFGYTKLTSPTSVNVLNPIYSHYDFTVTLTDPGNAYSDFRAYDQRFSVYKIYLPACGVFDIPAEEAGKMDLELHVMMDFLTKIVTYKIYHSGGTTIAQYEGKFGCQVPVIGAQVDVFGAVQSGVEFAGAVNNLDFFGALGGAFSVAQKIMQPTIKKFQSGAGNAEVMKEYPDIIFSVLNYASKDFPTTQAGRPCYKNKKISSCSGYNKCCNASVAIAGGAVEKEMVNNFLNSGFYYE